MFQNVKPATEWPTHASLKSVTYRPPPPGRRLRFIVFSFVCLLTGEVVKMASACMDVVCASDETLQLVEGQCCPSCVGSSCVHEVLAELLLFSFYVLPAAPAALQPLSYSFS